MRELSGKPEGYLKATPESFIVQELCSCGPVPLHTETHVKGADKAPVTYFHLVKRGIATRDALKVVARQLDVGMIDISCHGLKDRHAWTSQRIGIEGNFRPTFSHTDITLVQVGEGHNPLLIGGNKGNRFKISIVTSAKRINERQLESVPNYFGSQRFGSPNDHLVGQYLLEGRFDDAVSILHEKGYGAKLINLRKGSSSWRKALFAPDMAFEVKFALSQWQSFLWNQLLAEMVASNASPERLPMWGPETRRHYAHLWDPDHLNTEAVSLLHSSTRATRVRPQNLRLERKLMGWEISFDLPSGAYATVALSQIFDLKEHHVRN